MLDAAIVRVLKRERQLAHAQLRAQVNTQLKRPLDEPLFKKSLETLIDQGYLKRADDAPDLYLYVD